LALRADKCLIERMGMVVIYKKGHWSLVIG
jgi:hypothetical protein